MTSTEASQTDAGFAERDLTGHETRVRVLDAGTGEPLLYLHDSGDLGQWSPLLAGTVRQQIEHYASELGFGIFCGICQFGSLGHEEFERSVRLFADHVIPARRGAR